MNKKSMLSSLICHPALFPVTKRISSKKTLRILAYHRIGDIDEVSYPFDNELISSSVKDFDRQMKYAATHYRVMTFREIDEYMKNNGETPENALIVTFDDGYADNYENAFPILKKYNLKAVFFLTTDYIGTDRAFWFEKLAYYRKKGLIDASTHCTELHESNADRREQRQHCLSPAQDLHSAIIRAPNQDRLRMLERIEQAAPAIPEEDLALVKTLSWKQVLEMSEYGMEFGSHTQSHMVLGTGTREEVSAELRLSRHIIEQETSKPVSALSYPIASHDFAIQPWVVELAKQAGYRWGISNFPGPATCCEEERFMLKRLRIERYVHFDRYRAKLLFPGVLS